MLTLSGGDHGGEEFDASAVAIGEEFAVDTCIYRKISETQAVFAG